jgi:hypothetical protein
MPLRAAFASLLRFGTSRSMPVASDWDDDEVHLCDSVKHNMSVAAELAKRECVNETKFTSLWQGTRGVDRGGLSASIRAFPKRELLRRPLLAYAADHSSQKL